MSGRWVDEEDVMSIDVLKGSDSAGMCQPLEKVKNGLALSWMYVTN